MRKEDGGSEQRLPFVSARMGRTRLEFERSATCEGQRAIRLVVVMIPKWPRVVKSADEGLEDGVIESINVSKTTS